MKRNFCFYVLTSLMLLSFSSTAVSQFGDPVPRYPQEMDGMVNMINNNALYFSETDLAIPGRSLGIEFTRYYNADGLARSMRNLPYIGHKWSHSYQWGLYPTDGTSGTNDYRSLAVITGLGSQQVFTLTLWPWKYENGLSKSEWNNQWQDHARRKQKFRGKSGVRATLKFEKSSENWVFIYTTRGGIRYKFERLDNTTSSIHFSVLDYRLTEISNPNGNSLTLHYDATSERERFKNRLIAVEDTQGRILKFYYAVRIDDVNYPRFISKIEFGLGTPQAITTVYNTVKYSYTRYSYRESRVPLWQGMASYITRSYSCLTSVAHQLGSGDPRGAELKTQYEYYHPRRNSDNFRNFGYLSAIVSPQGYRTEFDYSNAGAGKVQRVRVEDVTPEGSTDGDVLYVRRYVRGAANAYNTDPETRNSPRHYYAYGGSSGSITSLTRRMGHSSASDIGMNRWTYSNRNVTNTYYYDSVNRKRKWMYQLYYAGSNAAHNRRMGNPTKWEQVETTSPYTAVLRTWEADYETKYNRPIWQIDPMGHKTTFTYDTKGNLTEQRSKANTGTNPTPSTTTSSPSTNTTHTATASRPPSCRAQRRRRLSRPSTIRPNTPIQSRPRPPSRSTVRSTPSRPSLNGMSIAG